MRATPLGFTTYAARAIERSHRLLEGLLREGYQHQNAAELIAGVCKVVSDRVASGAYKDMRSNVPTMPTVLYQWPQKKAASRIKGLDDAEGTTRKAHDCLIVSLG